MINSSVRPSTLSAGDIARLLNRHRRPSTIPDQVPVHELFEEILVIANQFVPSESGSLLIDDPLLKVSRAWDSVDNELVFVACFGEKAEQLVGRRLSASTGIVGKAYQSGEPVITLNASVDESFHSAIDEETSYVTRSVVCVPIRLGKSTCGVLELINREGGSDYTDSELELLKIFTGYISTSLQNMLDADRYRELAKRDDLTGLYNDRYFHQRLSEEVEACVQGEHDLSLIFLDLDHFKNVNDRHGHLVGSQTLREVGLILGRTVTLDKAAVARYGGDEFVIVAPHCSLEQAMELAERIRNKIGSALFRLEMGSDTGVMLSPGTVTASLGVASYRDLVFSAETKLRARKNDFIRAADQAMYRAKETGKNRVCRGTSAPPAPATG